MSDLSDSDARSRARPLVYVVLPTRSTASTNLNPIRPHSVVLTPRNPMYVADGGSPGTGRYERSAEPNSGWIKFVERGADNAGARMVFEEFVPAQLPFGFEPGKPGSPPYHIHTRQVEIFEVGNCRTAVYKHSLVKTTGVNYRSGDTQPAKTDRLAHDPYAA